LNHILCSGKIINIINIKYPDGTEKRYDWIPDWYPYVDQIFSDEKGIWYMSRVEKKNWDYYEVYVQPIESEQ